MGYKRADVEATALYAKKFVRYEEGAKKIQHGAFQISINGTGGKSHL